MVENGEFVVGLSAGIYALFSHVVCEGAQLGGLQTGGRAGQLRHGAASSSVISVS